MRAPIVDACSTLSVGSIPLALSDVPAIQGSLCVFPVLREVHIREGPRVRDETQDWTPGLNVALRNSHDRIGARLTSDPVVSIAQRSLWASAKRSRRCDTQAVAGV